jgi:hypothetical protein
LPNDPRDSQIDAVTPHAALSREPGGPSEERSAERLQALAPQGAESSSRYGLSQWTSPGTIGADELFWRGVLDPGHRALDQALVGQPR